MRSAVCRALNVPFSPAFFLSLALSMAAVLGCRAERGAYSLKAPSTIAWGVPVDGLQAGLTLEGLAEDSPPALRVRLTLRNIGEKSLHVHRVPANVAFLVDFMAVSIGKTAKKYTGPIPHSAFPGPDEFRELAPGESEDFFTTVPIAHYGLTAPVKAEIAWNYRWASERQAYSDARTGEVRQIEGLWSGELMSGPIEFEIR